MTKPEAILRVLRSHIGRDRSIGAAEIALAIGWSAGRARDVRRIISEERAAWTERLGSAVCNESGGGYWIATDFDELESVVRLFDGLAATATAKANAIRTSFARIGFTGFEPRTARTKRAEAFPKVLAQVFARQAALGWSHGRLARELRVAVSTVSRLNSGTYAGKVSPKLLRTAEAFLGKDIK